MTLLAKIPELDKNKRTGLLSLDPPSDLSPFKAIEILSSNGDLREAAANLFAAIRRLDEQGLDLILAQPVPEQGLGRAINDRLARASHL
jgi:L-threonylcarbamoyladenylate synthase